MNGDVQISWPKPGKAIKTLIAANVVCFVLYVLALRGGGGSVVSQLTLTPDQVFGEGKVWQLVTYMFLHSPEDVGHLVFNQIWLWLFGTALERWWGEKRFLGAYFIFGLSGSIATLIVALLSKTDVFSGVIGGFSSKAHLGSSGAVMGILMAWVIVHWNQTVHFLILGAMKGKTFLWLILGYEILVLISFEPVSSSVHFGGMLGAVVLTKGLWKPSHWKSMAKRSSLEAKKRKIEAELRIIQGGKDSGGNGHGGSNGTHLN